MSNYKNFVEDFPKRCRDVLNAFSESAKKRNRDVTLLLMASVAGFVMPYERLREGNGVEQPPLDRQSFTGAAKELRDLLDKTVGASGLFPERKTSWCFGQLKSAAGTPDDWPELKQPAPLSAETKVCEVLKCLRHGLAHCNVFSRSLRGEIAELIFVSGGTRRHSGEPIPLRYLVVSPGDLRKFLLNWFKFVEGIKIPPDLIADVVEAAA